MEFLIDNLTSFRGEFTLTEIKNGKSEIVVQEHNMIMNRAKESLAEILAGARMGEVGGAYRIQPINRFELGSGSHIGLTKIDPVNTLVRLRAVDKQLDGGTSTDADNQLYRIDFDPFTTGVANIGGPNGTTLTQVTQSAVKEFDNSILFGASGTPAALDTSADPCLVKFKFEETTDASGTYKNAILYEITIPELRANQSTPTPFSTTNPVYYSEAALSIRKGDLDTTVCDFDVFAIKTFPPRPKASDSKWVITWKIIF